jgi:hypothetical protein
VARRPVVSSGLFVAMANSRVRGDPVSASADQLLQETIASVGCVLRVPNTALHATEYISRFRGRRAGRLRPREFRLRWNANEGESKNAVGFQLLVIGPYENSRRLLTPSRYLGPVLIQKASEQRGSAARGFEGTVSGHG